MLTEEWNQGNTDRTNKIIGEVQLRKYGKLLETCTSRLRNLEESLIDSTPVFCEDVVAVDLIPKERCDIVDLVDTDNKVLNKVISVLAALCAEVSERKHEASKKFYNALLFFGEECDNEHPWMPQIATSKFLPKLQEISSFVARCQQLVLEMLQQLSVIYTLSPNNQIINASCLHFEDIMDHLGEILTVLVTLDELVINLDKIHENWSVYKRIINTVQLPISKERLITFENIVKDLENTVLSGKIFQNTLDKLCDIKNNLRNSRLPDEFSMYFKNMLSVLETKHLETATSRKNYSVLWLKVNCLFVLNFYLFGLHDKKTFRQMWEICRRFVCVNLVGNAIWFPDKFLMQHFSHAVKLEDKKQIQGIANTRLEFLNSQSQNLSNDVLKYSIMTCVWIIQLKTVLMQDTSHLKLEDLKGRCAAFLQGADIAVEISTHIKMIMNLHAALAKPMTKVTVLSLCKLIEILKCIEYTYKQYYFLIALSVSHVMQYLAYQILIVISTAKKRLVGDKIYTKKHLDTLSALVLVEKILHGPITAERYLIGRLALSVARGNPNKILKDDEVENIYMNLNNLNGIRKLQATISNACDTSFLYLHRVLLPIYFQNIQDNKKSSQRLYYMLSSISDSIATLHERDGISLAAIHDIFKTEINSSLIKYSIQPVCQEIETDLRLQVHSHLQRDKNIWKSENACKDFLRLIQLSPIKLFNNFISIKGHIENYLDTTFYNLTTVALHDWKTYGEMKSLAHTKYGIISVQNHLPYQTLEQGLDVLEIMRNIHIFVSKYLYNLNNQIFIEHSSNNKHLNTINIRHISNSIRMHGIGIMNTTVNFTYQFLRKKFYIFSQFLFDEQIKSRLTKDLLYFREHKVQLEQKYSYEKADKFNKGIRKLGLTPDGLSYLDQFRILISQIGNAMGYVRMIRSGGMHCCSNSLSFIPDLEDIVSYGKMARDDNLSESTCQSAQRLDHVINDLTKNFAEGTQYFKLLVDVFASDFRNPKNNHLQNFYVIVPALTINFIEYIIAAKDKINRRNKVGATFTDDGFAMGVAYVLQLLDQNKQFESLHWFQSVRDKIKRDKASLVKPSVTEEKLRTTMLLTAKRLDTFQQEFDLLYFSLSSARIFFQKQGEKET